MRSVRPAAAVLLAGSLALFVTGCEDEYIPEEKPSDGGSASPSASPSTPVDGDLGKTLDLGTPTKVSYKRAGGRNGTLQLTAEKVAKGSIDDLGDVRLDAEERSMQPYYVTMTYKNVGKTKLSHPYTPTQLRDARGEDAKALITLEDEVKPCPNDGEYELAVGAEQKRCKVFLVPKGQQPSVVMYTADFDKEPVFWKAKAEG